MLCRQNSKIFAVLGLAAALGAGGYWYYENHQQSGELKLYGNVDIRQVELAFLWPERIKEVLVEEGDVVKKNQVLATQDTDTPSPSDSTSESSGQCQLPNLFNSKKKMVLVPKKLLRRKLMSIRLNLNSPFLKKDLERVKEIFRATKGQGISQQNLDQAEAQLNVDKSH